MESGRDGETRSDRKHRKILLAARMLFTRDGYASTGMEAVARDAGVSTATLYAHFPSKAELFRAVVEDALDEIGGSVGRTAALKGDARTRLTAFCRAYARLYVDPVARAVFRMVMAERRRFEQTAEEMKLRSYEELGGTAIGIISDLAAEGALKVEKASWAAGQLLGMIEHATLVFSLMCGDEAKPLRPVEAVCDDAVETFLARYGVRGRAG